MIAFDGMFEPVAVKPWAGALSQAKDRLPSARYLEE